jgi:hypothetical protein
MSSIRAIPERRKRLLPQTWRGRLGLMGVVLLVVVLVGWILSRATPSWYQPLNVSDTLVIDNADRAQAKLLDLRNIPGRIPLGEQTWSIREEEVNSLLAIRFTPAAAGTSAGSEKPPPLVSDPTVIFAGGKITVCARTIRLPGGNPKGGVASAVFSVGIVAGPDGKPMGLARLTGAWVGDLPVPTWLVQSRVKAIMPALLSAADEALRAQLGRSTLLSEIPDAETILQSLVAGQPFPLEHTNGHRRFVIKDLRVEDGEFRIVLAPMTPAAVPPQPPTPPSR